MISGDPIRQLFLLIGLLGQGRALTAGQPSLVNKGLVVVAAAACLVTIRRLIETTRDSVRE